MSDPNEQSPPSEQSSVPPVTLTSNAHAAQTACRQERTRCLALLEQLRGGADPEAVARAMADGTPAAIFATSQRVRSGAAGPGSSRSPAPAAGSSARSGKWDAITSKRNARHRAAQGDGDAEAPTS